jgi:hypothetical protein
MMTKKSSKASAMPGPKKSLKRKRPRDSDDSDADSSADDNGPVTSKGFGAKKDDSVVAEVEIKSEAESGAEDEKETLGERGEKEVLMPETDEFRSKHARRKVMAKKIVEKRKVL